MVKQVGKNLLIMEMIMTRSDLIITMLDNIVNRINLSAEWRQDYETAKSIGLHDVVEYCATITKKPYAKVIEDIRSYVNNQDNMDEDLSYPQCYTLSVKNNQAQKRKFKKLRTDSDPYVCTLDVFGNNRNISITDDNWVVWERIWCSIANDATEKNKFWRELSSSNRSLIYIQTSEPNITPARKWNIYSYAYLKYINENKFPIPDILRESDNFSIVRPLSFNNNAKYDQFLDVYDVLNEVKHSDDTLTRFLKVYQVLELLAYRKEFQELIKEHVQHRYPIVRKIASLTDSFKKSEQKELSNLFSDCFSEIGERLDPLAADGTRTISISYLTPQCLDYIKKIYKVDADLDVRHPKYSTVLISKIVYQLRCSIVHNKETEFHYTYNNLEEYKAIVPLIKKLNELLLSYIVEIINQGNLLVYSHEKLNLY